jgi:hypothetical protein
MTPSMRFLQNTCLALLLGSAASCTTGAREGAAQGGAMGFVGGVAAGAVNSLLFGGNVLEGAVKGGVSGAAGGAAVGAVAGGSAEKQATEAKAGPTKKEVDALRKKFGDVNFQAAVALVQCKHEDAMDTANRALAEATKKNQKLFALTIRAAAEVESGKERAAEKTYAEINAIDPERSIDKAKADTLQVVLKVKGIRKDNGMAPCGGS